MVHYQYKHVYNHTIFDGMVKSKGYNDVMPLPFISGEIYVSIDSVAVVYQMHEAWYLPTKCKPANVVDFEIAVATIPLKQSNSELVFIVYQPQMNFILIICFLPLECINMIIFIPLLAFVAVLMYEC